MGGKVPRDRGVQEGRAGCQGRRGELRQRGDSRSLPVVRAMVHPLAGRAEPGWGQPSAISQG